MRSRVVRVRLGVVTAMASLIEYWVPEKFRKMSGRWIPPDQRGKIIPFPLKEKSRQATRCGSLVDGLAPRIDAYLQRPDSVIDAVL